MYIDEEVRYYRNLAHRAYMEAQDLLAKSEMYDEMAWRVQRQEVVKTTE